MRNNSILIMINAARGGLPVFRIVLLFFAVFCLGSVLGQAQTAADFEKPFSQCRSAFDKGDPITILASDNDIIYIANRQSLTAINARTLQPEWNTSFPSTQKPSAVLLNRTLTIASINNQETTLTSISADTGLIKWSVPVVAFKGEAPATLTLLSSSRLLVFDESGKVAVVDQNTGMVFWFRDFQSRPVDVSRLNDELALLFSSSLLLLDIESGKTRETVNTAEEGSVLVRIIGDRSIIGSFSGTIFNSGSDSAGDLWSIKTGARVASLQTVGEQLLATSFDNFAYFLNISSGAIVWKKRIGSRILYKPTVVNSLAIISNSFEGTALIVDLKDGRTINKVKGSEDTPFTGGIHLIASRLFVPTIKGLLVFSANGCK